MKKLISVLVTGFLVVGTFGCQDAPSSTNGGTQTPTESTSQTNKIPGKAFKSTDRETMIPVTGIETKDKLETKTNTTTKSGEYLKTIISKKLQIGIPGNKFVVENKQGEIILKGAARSQAELDKAEKIIKEIKGVKSLKLEAKVEPSNRS